MEVAEEVKSLCITARGALPALAAASAATRNGAIAAMGDALVAHTEDILAANKKDLDHAAANGVAPTMLDRLALSEARIRGIADAMRELLAIPDPLAGTEEVKGNPKITITRVKVPIGLIAVIFEARPNVTADAAALAIKSGNAVVLRGGKEAIESNRAIVSALREALLSVGLPAEAVSLVTSTDRAGANALLSLRGVVDLLIPRGGKALIANCVENAKVPVIETGAGVCHVYIDRAADLDMALAVTVNAKCQRPSVCNAAETLLVHRAVASAFLPRFYEATRAWNLALRGCPETCRILPHATPIEEGGYATEYNDYIMSVKVVESLDEAVAHIGRYGTRHSEAIVTADEEAARLFCRLVDAAAVYHNASTRFTDGGEFGFGAEIGISTQKLHVRGPVGPAALTTTKYIVTGDGATR